MIADFIWCRHVVANKFVTNDYNNSRKEEEEKQNVRIYINNQYLVGECQYAIKMSRQFTIQPYSQHTHTQYWIYIKLKCGALSAK